MSLRYGANVTLSRENREKVAWRSTDLRHGSRRMSSGWSAADDRACAEGKAGDPYGRGHDTQEMAEHRRFLVSRRMVSVPIHCTHRTAFPSGSKRCRSEAFTRRGQRQAPSSCRRSRARWRRLLFAEPGCGDRSPQSDAGAARRLTARRPTAGSLRRPAICSRGIASGPADASGAGSIPSQASGVVPSMENVACM